MKQLGRDPDDELNKVSALTQPDGQGLDENRLREYFAEPDIRDILLVGRTGTSDVLSWNFMKSVIFSVKSAYHMGMQRKRLNEGVPEPSSSYRIHAGWLALWDTKVPGKVKVHMWRLIQKGLAVGAQLQRWKSKQGVICIACDHEENLEHRF
jgi:hypothetical protein